MQLKFDTENDKRFPLSENLLNPIIAAKFFPIGMFWNEKTNFAIVFL